MMSTGTWDNRPAPSASHEGDLALAATAAAGDQTARRKLVERVLERTRRAVTYLVGADREAEDMAQIALVQILKSAHTFRAECTLEYWADRIAVRTVMRELRRRKRRDEIEPEALVLSPPAPGADEQADLARVRTRLAQLLGKLTRERRTAVVLHHVQGYRIEEIAAITGAPVNTVRDRLRIGRKQLRKRILADPALRAWLDARNR